MAANNQQFGNRSDNPPRKVNEVSISVDERLDKLTSLVERLIVGNTQQVKACGICTSSGHATNACPTLHEECTMHANAVGGFSRPPQRGHDHFSNTYNPEWRDYPKLRYGDQPQNFQRPPYQQPPPPPQANTNSGMPLEDIVKTLALSTQQFQQETRASIQNLESQMSQLASSVSRLESQGKTGEELKIPPNQVERSELTQEEHPKVFVPRPPFPEQFAKSKKEEDDKEIFETLSKVEVNIPLLDAIKQVPRYAKFLKEMCTNKSKLRGRPFLKTSKTKIDVDAGILSMEFDNEVHHAARRRRRVAGVPPWPSSRRPALRLLRPPTVHRSRHRAAAPPRPRLRRLCLSQPQRPRHRVAPSRSSLRATAATLHRRCVATRAAAPSPPPPARLPASPARRRHPDRRIAPPRRRRPSPPFLSF
ncbi:UNVERIFIED_CONTAM: hypothetical protein Sradi_2032700 [Sesamum radiatum]|uniref:Retrotransposon gag protein n=1 Tax=Sesamum radiatum TaxID=300843 RepID=A0AAW2TH03_SESRA